MKISLINMPFAAPDAPSIALEQLRVVLDKEFGNKISLDVHYINLDFVRFINDLPFLRHVVCNEGYMSGIGDWFFRQAAFPEAPDNTEEYLAEFYPELFGEPARIKQIILEKRPKVQDFLEELSDKYSLAQSDIVGFSSLFIQSTASFAMAAKLKELNPELVTVMGGAACEGVMGMEFARNVPAMDYIFSGPGLITFPEFVSNMLNGDPAACDEIEGVFSGEEAVDESLSYPVGADRDINENIILDYGPFLDKFNQTFPDRELKPLLLFETSRGCSWGEKMPCTFCGLNGLLTRHRFMTDENAEKQLKSVLKWADRCDFFVAVDTVVPRSYLAGVFPKIAAPEGVKLMYEVRTDLTEQEVRTLCQAGIRVIQPGIEALNSDTLKLMRKGSTAFRNISFMKICCRYPISLSWNLLLFSPGENEAVLEKYLHDLPLLTHLEPPAGAFPVDFMRYSRYFEDKESYGLKLRPKNFYRAIYPFDEETLYNVAYHFVDMNADRVNIDRWLDVLQEKIEYWRNRWHNRDNLQESRLCTIEDSGKYYVYDSRTGYPVYHEISEEMLELLKYLEKPANSADIALYKPEITGQPEKIAFLLEKGLIFEEKGRYLNLVIL